MRYTAFTAVVVALTCLICWSHWQTVDAHPAAAAGGGASDQQNPWTPHKTTSTTTEDNATNTLFHMCISERKYVGLSTAIRRLEEELRIVTNLTFINSGNHTIPTLTYAGFTQQLSLIKDILKTIEDEEDDNQNPNVNPMPNFRHINFTDLLPWLPKWDLHASLNSTNSSRSIYLDTFKDYVERYHHEENVFLHMLIEFLLNLQQNFENFFEYVDQFSHRPMRHDATVAGDKFEELELRFDDFASSILQKISQLEQEQRSMAEEDENRRRIAKKDAESSATHGPSGRIQSEHHSVASPVWQDHTVHNASLVAIEDKVDVLHEKFINFAKDTEERLAILEARSSAIPAAITTAKCNGSQRHLVGSSCYSVPWLLAPGAAGAAGGGPSAAGARLYTWWDARYLCKQLLGPHADLAAIRTETQMRGLMRMLHNHFGAIEEYWLGASDLDTEGQWTWVDGHPLGPYTNWANQPVASEDKNCLSMLRGYRWTDEPCFYERTPICELKLE